MNNHHKLAKLTIIIAAILAVPLFLAPSHAVFAEDSSTITETTFFGNLKDDGKGCGVYTVLNLIVDILSIGIGIVSVIGITIVGIQYLTAGGNEAQTTKAKRRLSEIVIGIIAYVLLYALMQWLLPGGKLNTTTCQTVTDEQLAEIKAKEEAERQAKQAEKNKQNQKGQKNPTAPVSADGLTLSAQIAKKYTPAQMAKLINKGKIAPSPVCTNCTWSERIAETAELLAWPKGTARSKYHYDGNRGGHNYKGWSDIKGAKPNRAYRNAIDKVSPNHKFESLPALGADCGNFVVMVLRYSGYNRGMRNGDADGYLRQHGWKSVKTAKRGDVCVTRGGGSTGFHTWIYLGNGLSAEANYTGKNFGHIVKRGCRSATSIVRVKT